MILSVISRASSIADTSPLPYQTSMPHRTIKNECDLKIWEKRKGVGIKIECDRDVWETRFLKSCCKRVSVCWCMLWYDTSKASAFGTFGVFFWPRAAPPAALLAAAELAKASFKVRVAVSPKPMSSPPWGREVSTLRVAFPPHCAVRVLHHCRPTAFGGWDPAEEHNRSN